MQDPVAQIGKWIYVTVSEFQGKQFIDVRKYYDSDGEMKPTKKGIAFDPKIWQEFVEKITQIDEEVKKRIKQE